MSWTTWISMGGVFGALGVAFGAFAAHALKTKLPQPALEIFEIGVRYQMYHALALLAVGFVASRIDTGAVRLAGISLTFGIIVFSGTLYAMAFGAPRWLGAVTPLGGLGFILGWLSLAWAAARLGS